MLDDNDARVARLVPASARMTGPYGEHAVAFGDLSGQQFTGKLWDTETAMYHFPYRQYSPASARWLTRDLLGMVDGPNMYAYVMGNPVNHTDSLGTTILPFPVPIPPDGGGGGSSTTCDSGYKNCMKTNGIEPVCGGCKKRCERDFGNWSDGRYCGPGPLPFEPEDWPPIQFPPPVTPEPWWKRILRKLPKIPGPIIIIDPCLINPIHCDDQYPVCRNA